MDAQLSLKELMNPKRLETQARYNNAQISVDMAYRLAERQVYIADTKVLSLDWKEGDPAYDKYTYIEASSTEKINKLVELARLLKVQIEKDLNDTLKVLDETKEVSDGLKTANTKLS